MAVSTMACVSKGKTACSQGFFREPCTKCTRGSTACSICIPPKRQHQHKGLASPSCQSTPSSPTFLCSSRSTSDCLFCVDGQKVCEDCFGLGFVQRICQDCIKDYYRKQSASSKSKKSSPSSSLSSSCPSQFLVLSPSEQRKMLVCHSTISHPPPSSISSEMSSRNCSSLSLERSECDYSDDSPSSSSSWSQKPKGKVFSIRSMITRRIIRPF
ncbi:hypothetical protein BG006_000681 [Podila minutissima]|uniref:Uncharacterized protein n=1 Tax=Podila minutissima TaxID=64525 RepID=A0A9P5VHN1_9FUNG|nr:hypothetical protein BG006_000681 [Podila minutissima]